jgi:hypothetical protein
MRLTMGDGRRGSSVSILLVAEHVNGSTARRKTRMLGSRSN